MSSMKTTRTPEDWSKVDPLYLMQRVARGETSGTAAYNLMRDALADIASLAQRCRNLEAVQQAGLECSGRIKAAAGALGWTADREDGPLEFLIEQAQRCRELQEQRDAAWVSVSNTAATNRKLLAERNTLRAELDKLRRWEKEVRENSPLLIRLDSAEAERDVLRGLLAECAEYLNTNSLTSIGHGSILHRKMIDAAMEATR